MQSSWRWILPDSGYLIGYLSFTSHCTEEFVHENTVNIKTSSVHEDLLGLMAAHAL